MTTPVRVMWLLNHTTARRFEIPMLKRLGISEIFLPKRYPNDPGFRTASVDYSEDANLTIPSADLEILNAADWYDDPGPIAMAAANRHFDVAFFIMQSAGILKALSRGFDGAVIWRAYGLDATMSYAKALDYFSEGRGQSFIRALGSRFWFGQAYANLEKLEPALLSSRSVLLPAGLADSAIQDEWSGSKRAILFVCPDIEINPYYRSVYETFSRDFSDLPYLVAGAQPIAMRDPRILGFLPTAEHRRNMREMRVMYYHSTEPNHVHYHPFEAVQAGMPLIFMAGGILDRIGGETLPGRCQSVAEAKQKITRILNDDQKLIRQIRKTQVKLLEPLSVKSCEPAWRTGMARILESHDRNKRSPARASKARKPHRIAVLLPELYKGGSLLAAKLLAEAIEMGSRQCGETAEVVFGHIDAPNVYAEEDFSDLPAEIARRPHSWITMTQQEAARALALAGLTAQATSVAYICPNDGIQQFLDCDLWVLVSDRLSYPLLPVRPYVMIVHDYLQRYENVVPHDINITITAAARRAMRVLVTTEFTRQDAIQFAGVATEKVIRVPMLAPRPYDLQTTKKRASSQRYFHWVSNLGLHKNHENAFKALVHYYQVLDGKLECRVTGVNTDKMLESDAEHLQSVKSIFAKHPFLKKMVKFLGELPYPDYRRQLSEAAFVWNPTRIDNGTFSVIEAAQHEVPTLSSDYPAIREVAAQFGIAIEWMSAYEPIQMATQIKKMEQDTADIRKKQAASEKLAKNTIDRLAKAYWEAIRECL